MNGGTVQEAQARFLSLCLVQGTFLRPRRGHGERILLCRDCMRGQKQTRRDSVIITCGICGNNIELVGNVADGQHIRCPFCGKTSAYRKPSRIELPPRKPKLGVRRPQARQETSAEADRANDLVQQVEARADAKARKARAARRKAPLQQRSCPDHPCGSGLGRL